MKHLLTMSSTVLSGTGIPENLSGAILHLISFVIHLSQNAITCLEVDIKLVLFRIG